MVTFINQQFGLEFCVFPELKSELEFELIPSKMSEWELELIPNDQYGIGIGINSIFFGICNGLGRSDSAASSCSSWLVCVPVAHIMYHLPSGMPWQSPVLSISLRKPEGHQEFSSRKNWKMAKAGSSAHNGISGSQCHMFHVPRFFAFGSFQNWVTGFDRQCNNFIFLWLHRDIFPL